MSALPLQGSIPDPAERRLVRLSYDLHDGPLQDVAALTADVRLFRVQLAAVLSAERHPALGRVDDLEARLRSLDRDLREFAHALEPLMLLEKPFADALREENDAFLDSSDAALHLEIDGQFEGLTASQRIALLRVAREALANVRLHSGATAVHVFVVGGSRQIRLQVTDNGRGFVLPEALGHAARAGRLGLRGMSERIRLLGGTFTLDTRPGGPTTVSAVVPRWRPAPARPIRRRRRAATSLPARG